MNQNQVTFPKIRQWGSYVVALALGTALAQSCVPSNIESNIQNPTSDTAAVENQAIDLRYQKLQHQLAAGQWQEANQETADQMLAVMNRTEEGWLREGDIQRFPCQHLRTIDRLWVDASDGRFGFSVQKRIWMEVGGTLDDTYLGDEIWFAFGDRVGWRQPDGKWLSDRDTRLVTEDTPPGHLPWWGGFGFWGELFVFSRVETCGL